MEQTYSQPFASIHIAKSLEKPTAKAKTCQRVWLPHRFFADPKKLFFLETLVLRLRKI